MNKVATLAHVTLLNLVTIGYILFNELSIITVLYFLLLEIFLLHISFSIASLVIAKRVSDISLRNKYRVSSVLYLLSLVFYYPPLIVTLFSISLLRTLELQEVVFGNSIVFEINKALDFYTEHTAVVLAVAVYLIAIFLSRLLRVPYVWNTRLYIKRIIIVLLSPLLIILLWGIAIMFMTETGRPITSKGNFITQVALIIIVLKAYLLDYLPLLKK